jgi:hypothetical protein
MAVPVVTLGSVPTSLDFWSIHEAKRETAEHSIGWRGEV